MVLLNQLKNFIELQLWNFHYGNPEINQHFLIPDNIDKDKFSKNAKVDKILHAFIKIRPPHKFSDEDLIINNQVFLNYAQKEIENSTPSFRQLDFIQNYHLRPLGDFPAWFIWAYPDVILWLSEIESNNVDESYKEVMSFMDDSFNDDRQMYRKLIDTYKKSFRLEVSKS